MKKNDDRAFSWEWLAMLVMAVVIYACASRGYTEGGHKDTNPPRFLMIRRPPRSTLEESSSASDLYKRQG